MSSNPYKTPKGSGSTRRVKKSVIFGLGRLLCVLCIVGLVIALLLPAVRRAGPAARRMQCTNNLKQIAMALHNYEAKYQRLPPAYTVDSTGRPLHSWRTLILPFLEQKPLYDSIDLSKPYDDPANTHAYETSPKVFRCPSADALPCLTTYMAIEAPNGCFDAAGARQFSEITDDPSETLMVIELPPQDAIHWMAPQDADARFVLNFDQETGFAHIRGTNAAFADGSVRFLFAEMPEAERRAMITIAGSDSATDAAESEAPR